MRNNYITQYYIINTEYQSFTFHFISFYLHLYVLLYKFCNNNHHIILCGLKRVKLSDDNIAQVVFVGEDETTWINLYTMQEFAERPAIERSGFVELLKAKDRYYFYRYRQLAGIPIKDGDYAVNGMAFQFMRQYVILKEHPNCIYIIDDEYRKGGNWVVKLKSMETLWRRAEIEIPSEYLPARFVKHDVK